MKLVHEPMMPNDVASMMQRGVENLKQSLAHHHANLAQMLNQHADEVHMAATAPKRVIRDHNGRVAGIETVTQ